MARTRSLDTMLRDARALELRRAGMSYTAVAKELGVAYSSAYEMVHRALRDQAREGLEEARQIELERLDRAQRAVEQVLATRHILVQQGNVIKDPRTGQPMLDDAPILSAVDRVVKLSKRRSELLGLDAPTRVEQEVTVTDGGVDAEIRALVAAMGAAGGLGGLADAEEAGVAGDAAGEAVEPSPGPS